MEEKFVDFKIPPVTTFDLEIPPGCAKPEKRGLSTVHLGRSLDGSINVNITSCADTAEEAARDIAAAWAVICLKINGVETESIE